MAFLHFLESIRTGFGDAFMSLVTRLGEETLFIVVALVFMWCIGKREGYYLLTVGFIGIIANQFLKILCRIPRPWVKDPSFTIVESAREAATGYSFPSGHTQTAVGLYGGVAHLTKRLWLRILLIAVCFLVGLSRMYLGVHTPLDVLVSLGIGTVLVFALYPFFESLEKHPHRLYILLGVLLLVAVALTVYVECYPFPADVDAHNLHSARKNAYTMLGCLVGFFLSYYLDQRYIHYSVKAPLVGQILKLAVGLGLALLIKLVAKAPLVSLLGDEREAVIRYFLMVAFAGGVWPLTFPFFQKIKIGKRTADTEKQ